MILSAEIEKGDIVKAMVKEFDSETEEEAIGVVEMNTGNTLGVRFLTPTEKFYKSACVYELDEEMTATPYESLFEHYPGGTLEDLEIKGLGDDYYVFYAEVDIEDDDSDIWEDGTDSEMDDFIVSDSEEVEGVCLPPGHEAIDKAWDDWQPRTPGARSFKETVDMIEAHAREKFLSSW
ncbi:hypothetical protein [Dishui Lake phycodnavirus 2]|nr:hypothetical protein [Dishui Lake phycodnavirus 2]